jgi:hypothetical protein
VINNRYALVGAQPYEVFKNALEQIMNQKGWLRFYECSATAWHFCKSIFWEGLVI